MAEHQPPETRRLSPAGHALLVTLIALLLGALLNARALERTAARLPFGTGRSIAVAVTGSLRAVSSFLLLDRPRLALDNALGRPDESEAEPAASPPLDPAPAAPTRTTTTTTTTAGTGFRLRTPTPDRPLQVWIVGDSLMELLGPSLVNLADESGVVDAEVDFRFVSGLTRRDFFDWPAHAREQIPIRQPEVIIAMFGGNDGQDVVVDGVAVERWTPAWVEFYRGRVSEAMDVFTSGGAHLYWIGLPVMRNAVFSDHVRLMNDVYLEEAAERPLVTVVESWDHFTDENGDYSAYLLDDRGRLELMRYDDGVHFTWAGARRLAAVVVERMSGDWED